MLLDAQNQYSDAQAVAVTGPSTNLIDHGTPAAGRGLGIGEPLVVLCSSDVLLSAGTLIVTLQTDTVVGFGTATTVANTPALAAANIPVGTRFVLNVPPDKAMKRYSRLNYTLSAGTITITAELIPLRLLQLENVFQGAFTILA